jgi:pimeloyl-ACP methyl ester carboxylesterase
MPGPIVMIHGAFAGGWCFENFSDALSAHGWTCRAPNLRFHGAGPTEPDPRLAATSIADYTADMAQLLAGLPDKPVLLGHSMGGIIAQQLAAKGLARALVLLASGAPWGILPSSDAERAIATGLMSAGDFWTRALQPVFEVAANDSLANLAPSAQRQVFDRLGAESGRALFELFFWMFDGKRTTAVDAAGVTCPVLVIAGAQDKVISPATGRRIAQRYGERATFHEAPDHGHFLLLEPGWQHLAQRCADWLAALESVKRETL